MGKTNVTDISFIIYQGLGLLKIKKNYILVFIPLGSGSGKKPIYNPDKNSSSIDTYTVPYTKNMPIPGIACEAIDFIS